MKCYTCYNSWYEPKNIAQLRFDKYKRLMCIQDKHGVHPRR